MRRVVIVIPELLGDPEAESPLRQKLPGFELMAEHGELFKIAQMPPVETPEALYLGMAPGDGQLRQGPLTVSALGADPPDRSTHFHLSLMSYQDGSVSQPSLEITDEDLRAVLENANRLNTKLLTIVPGEGPDHGLVWEALGDIGDTPNMLADGKELKSVLPEGDGEVALRRFIDDSINLLTDLELNERRIDEGLPPFNLLWPWGNGVRRSLPNLFLQRGERATVESSSLRMQGLVRLTGYVHESRSSFGRGLGTKLEAIASRALSREVSIILVETPAQLRAKELEEELHWFVRELDARLIKPLIDESAEGPAKITVLAPSSATGLGMVLRTPATGANSIPFDERALEEKVLRTNDLWRSVESGLS